MRRPSKISLRQASSIVFGLAAVLPILLFVYLLSHASLLQRTEVQIGLFLAVAVSVLGFLVFRRMVGQIARLADGLQPPRSADSALGTVPGLGPVTEISQVTGAFYEMLGDLRSATQRLEDLVFKLVTLNETVELAARIPRIQDLLGQALQTTMRAVRATLGSIMILDRERQTLRTAASRGFSPVLVEDVEIKVGEGVAGKVVQSGEPLVMNDIETHPRCGEPDVPRIGSASFLCLPIRAGDRVIGVINMAKRRDGGEAHPPAVQPHRPAIPEHADDEHRLRRRQRAPPGRGAGVGAPPAVGRRRSEGHPGAARHCAPSVSLRRGWRIT
jgi:putative methionine-R-sulfoxide reductase with GAF domain